MTTPSAARTATSSVEVAADPATAFSIFTEEVHLWWRQGPINFHDSSRAHGKRIEPGVGGRVVEVYDLTSGDGLELGRVTVWEPGARLAWHSSLDDVEVEVTFTPSDADGRHTLVRVEATVPAGGRDMGGTSWVRMTPFWLGTWVDQRAERPHRPERLARLALGVHYAKPVAAVRWLHEVFGFAPSAALPEADAPEPPDDLVWFELEAGAGARIMVFKRTGDLAEEAPVTHTPWVFVDHLDAHHAGAVAGGATIVDEIWQHGARAYTAADLEGHHWTFAQAGPNMR
jgi:uncharacterized glyoxalase superfamily protein PhnB